MSETLHILIVDDDRMMAKTLCDIFRVKGYQAEVANSGTEALDWVERETFDCVLSDIKMPEVNGVELYKAIKAQQPDLPVVLMTAYAADELIAEGLEEGVIAALSKPVNINLVLSFFSMLSQERPIVIVDNDANFCRTLGDILRERGFSVASKTDPDGLVDEINGEQVILLDMQLGDTDGLTVLKAIREKYPQIPVLLVTGFREEMAPAIEAALAISAYTCFYKPLQIDELLQTLNVIHRQELGRKLGRMPKKKPRK